MRSRSSRRTITRRWASMREMRTPRATGEIVGTGERSPQPTTRLAPIGAPRDTDTVHLGGHRYAITEGS